MAIFAKDYLHLCCQDLDHEKFTFAKFRLLPRTHFGGDIFSHMIPNHLAQFLLLLGRYGEKHRRLFDVRRHQQQQPAATTATPPFTELFPIPASNFPIKSR
jgi:hypothetical protein